MDLVWGLQRLIQERSSIPSQPYSSTVGHTRCSGRSCYVFHVGRVNEAKLGNFPEVCSDSALTCSNFVSPRAQVGAFCVIAAAEHSLFRSLDMPAPVIRCDLFSALFIIYVLLIF
jgi:hypothetical protein